MRSDSSRNGLEMVVLVSWDFVYICSVVCFEYT